MSSDPALRILLKRLHSSTYDIFCYIHAMIKNSNELKLYRNGAHATYPVIRRTIDTMCKNLGEKARFVNTMRGRHPAQIDTFRACTLVVDRILSVDGLGGGMSQISEVDFWGRVYVCILQYIFVRPQVIRVQNPRGSQEIELYSTTRYIEEMWSQLVVELSVINISYEGIEYQNKDDGENNIQILGDSRLL